MEVVVPAAAAADFIFDSASTTPYVSAPSSPRPFGSDWPSARYYYTSAPTSPARAAAIFRDFSTAVAGGLSSPRSPASSSRRSSVTPFDWEEKEHKEKDDVGDQVDDFAFEFSGQLEMGSGSPLTADELFDRGMIRPLKPPPRLQYAPPVGGAAAAWDKASMASPKSPRSPKSPKSPRSKSSFLPWCKQDDFDPFAKAMEETTRGRDRSAQQSKPAGATRRTARSLSPLRGVFDFEGKPSSATSAESSSAAGGSMGVDAAPAAAAAPARWSKKWRLRDLLLFRSASEGRATGGGRKDPLRKYTALSPSSAAILSRKGSAASISSAGSREEIRNGSFRSVDGGSVGGSSRWGGGAGGSAHGRHYPGGTRAAAASEEMRRRKTMLPYQQGLFGCLGFNPAINGLARGFSSFSRSRS